MLYKRKYLFSIIGLQLKSTNYRVRLFKLKIPFYFVKVVFSVEFMMGLFTGSVEG